jgi:hypothetical protein
MLVPLLAAVLAAAVSSGAAAAEKTSYADTITGYEFFATSTHGDFAGTASGSLPGAWTISVRHARLCLSCTPTATIAGGSVSLVSRLGGDPVLVRGTFAAGTVQVTNPGAGCTNQTFTVNGVLRGVGTAGRRSGSGTFTATLTHHRRRLFGRCVTYAASVKGTLAVIF